MATNQKLETTFTANTKDLRAGVKEAAESVKGFGKDTNSTAKEVKSRTKEMQDAFSGVTKATNALRKGFRLLFGYRVGQFFGKAIKESTAFIERLNLFRVATGESRQEMEKFVNQMVEAFGIDPSTLMKTVGTFRQLTESMGLATAQADLLTKNFTKAAFDLASLFELEIGSAIEKLEAGLVGLPKPLRDIGIVTTVTALQTEALRLGIDGSVRSMKEIDKVGLRYVAIMRQMKNAMGDFATTIESPSNQLRVMQEQLQQLTRSIGNLFIGMIDRILPYINGFIMALRVVIDTIAVLFGYKDKTFENSVGGVGGAVEDVGDAATDAAKKAKQLLAPFDELNILSEQASSSAGGVGGFGEMDPRIVAAMKEYDNLMSSVRMKANDIRDKLLEILGFTKKINEETGEITWTWNLEDFKTGMVKGFQMAIDAWKEMTPGQKAGAIFTTGWVAWIAGSGIKLLLTPFLGIGGKIAGLLIDGIKKIKWPKLPPIDTSSIAAAGTTVTTIFGTVKTTIAGFFGWISTTFSGLWSAITTFFGGVSASAAAVVAAVIAAIALVVGAIIDLWNNSEEFRTNVIALWNEIKDKLSDLWEVIKEMFNDFVEFLMKLWEDFRVRIDENVQMIKDIFESLVQFYQEYIAPAIAEVVEVLKRLWERFKEVIEVLVYLVMEIFSGLIDFLIGVFTGDWEKCWEAVKSIFNSVFKAILNIGIIIVNSLIDVFEDAINWIIGGLNDLIDAWNSTVEDVPGIGGSLTVSNISTVSFGRIPKAERGGSFGAGDLFRAGEKGKMEVTGDYGGKTTVMPLENTGFVSAIKQAVQEGVQAAQAASGGNDRPIKVIIGGKEWDTMVYNSSQRGRTRVGQQPLSAGGAFNV